MPIRAMPLPALLLAACMAEESAPVAPEPALGPIAAADQACLRAVSEAAGTAQVRIVNSDFGVDGIRYQIGAGPAETLWRCVGGADGTASGIAPLA